MPTPETVEAFAAEVEAGRFVEAIEGFYVETASMQENTDAPRVGRDVLVAGEKQVMAGFAAITAQLQGPILIDGDHVAIRWLFEFTTRDGAKRTLEEIAWQRWEGDRIVEEQFFYDPKQLGR
jgi:hypothetical protein